MVSGREVSEESDLRTVEKVRVAEKNKVGLLTRTVPTSFVTRTTQERREARMAKITRQRYGMEE